MFRKKYWKIHNLFSFSKKEFIRISKNGEEIRKTIPYRLIKRVYKVKYKNGHNDKKCETCGIESKSGIHKSCI